MKAPKMPGTQDFYNFDNSSDSTPPFGTPPSPVNFGKSFQEPEEQEVNNINQNQQYGYEDQGDGESYEYEGQDEYITQGGFKVFGLKVAGILLVLLAMFMIWKFFSTKQIAEERRIENLVKLNPSGGYYDGTQDTYEPEYTEGNVDWVEDSEGIPVTIEENEEYSVVTEIMKYQKYLSNDGRPYLTVQNDKYGTYDIYIPYQQYQRMEESGYILTDIEVVDNNVRFLYISSKQENLENLINK